MSSQKDPRDTSYIIGEKDIESLYQDVLKRAPEKGAVQNWMEWIRQNPEGSANLETFKQHFTAAAQDELGIKATEAEDVSGQTDVVSGLGTGDVPIYDPGVTQLEEDLQDVLYGQMTGDIPKLTAQMVEEQKDILRPTYATMSEEEKASTAEKFRTAGRLRGSRQMYEQEKLKSMQEGRLTTAAISQANTELGRIDASIGRGLAAGLTFSEMEAKKDMLTSEQKYGLGMYQVKIKDQAKLYFADAAMKEHWMNLERAWAEEDWDAYAELAKELTAAQMPDLADYLMSFVPYAIMAI